MSKILLCSEFYLPHIGGVEIHTKTLFNYFNKKKVKSLLQHLMTVKEKTLVKKIFKSLK